MANSHTYRYGQRRLRTCPVASDTVISKGDMVWFDTSEDEVFPASDFAWDSNLATTQAGFADVFMGIAAEQSADGDTDPIDVDVSPDSVYQFSVASASYKLDSTLGPDEGSTNLKNQVLEGAVPSSSVAVSCEHTSGSVTSLHVSFASVYNPSANTAAGAIG